jgi:hypothetical protein
MRIKRFRVARGGYAAGILSPLLVAACIPYTVGTTAQPLRAGQNSTSMSTFVMPSIGGLESSRSASFLAVDFERRFGLDDRSDLGVRVPSGSGLIVNYKRLLTDSSKGTQVAVMPGAGFVNLGEHAHFELTLLASARERPPVVTGVDTTLRPTFVPYAGIRVMQVAPLAQGAAHDLPTAGAFLGVKIGGTDFGISPEIGFFYDHSTLGVRRGDLVVVPAISVHGARLIRMIRDIGRGGSILGGGILRVDDVIPRKRSDRGTCTGTDMQIPRGACTERSECARHDSVGPPRTAPTTGPRVTCPSAYSQSCNRPTTISGATIVPRRGP